MITACVQLHLSIIGTCKKRWEMGECKRGEVYIQSTPLYQYNTVYSQESTIII